jgi:antitoxin HicB
LKVGLKMEKNIEYYMNLPYTRELVLGSDGLWFVRVKELPGCFSQGKSQEEALRMIDDAMLGWLEVELEDGEVIPEPRLEEDYSGKFNTRVPKSLHRKLVDAADDDGVSLNQWINSALAEAVGAAKRVASVDKNQELKSFEPNALQGLEDGIHSLLLDVGMKLESGSSEEKNFSFWLTQNIMDSVSDCDSQSFEQAFAKSKDLAQVLGKYSKNSPLLGCLYKLVSTQTKLLDQFCILDDDRQQEREINQAINNILESASQKKGIHRRSDYLELELFDFENQVNDQN